MPIGDILFSSGGVNNVNMISSDNPLSIYLPGVLTPENIGQGVGGTTFTWDSITDANQPTGNGLYYIKFEQVDKYAHTNVLIKTITTIDVREYVEIDIYNSAGELVKLMKEYKTLSPSNISLKVPTYYGFDKVYTDVTITYGNNLTDYVKWDGNNEQGIAVDNGVYEIQVNLVNNQGRTKVESKAVTVLHVKDKFLNSIMISPNPYFKGKSVNKVITFSWITASPGEIKIAIYNMAGEKVKEFKCRLSETFVRWDLKTVSGEKAADGKYVVLFESKNEKGVIEMKTLKMAIVSKK